MHEYDIYIVCFVCMYIVIHNCTKCMCTIVIYHTAKNFHWTNISPSLNSDITEIFKIFARAVKVAIGSIFTVLLLICPCHYRIPLSWCKYDVIVCVSTPSSSSLQSKIWRERCRSISKSWRGCDKPRSWTRNDSSMKLSSRKKLLGWVEITKLACLQIR